jgi:hypothetical protein
MAGITFVINPPITYLTSTGITVVCVFLCLVAFLTVGVRYYTRIWIVKSVGWDDHLTLIATILLTAYCALLSAGFRIGLNVVAADQHIMTVVTNIVLAIETFYIVTIGVFKVSLALFFLRVTVSSTLRKSIIWVVSVISVYGIGYFFFAIFQCGTPHGSTFFIQKLENQCASYAGTMGPAYTHGILMAGTDLFFLVLVFPIVAPTKLRLREKINVAILLGIGTL